MATTDYRSLDAPALIDTSTYNDGSAAKAAALSDAFTGASRLGQQELTKYNVDEGQKTGLEAGLSGQPNFKTGFFAHTAGSEAYNNAAVRGYVIQSQADAQDAAARIETTVGDDPAQFRAIYGEHARQTVLNAPPEARGALTQMFTQLSTESEARLAVKQADGMRHQARTDIASGVERSTARIAKLEASGDPVLMQQADEERAHLGLLIDGGRNDGTYSPVETAAMHVNAQKAITAQTIETKFQDEMLSPTGDPVGFIEKLEFQNRLLMGPDGQPVLDPSEMKAIKKNLFDTLSEQNRLDAMDRKNGNNAANEKLKAGDRLATSLALQGLMTKKKLAQMVASQDLSAENARAIEGLIDKGDTEKSDGETKFKVENNLLDYSVSDIQHMHGLSWEDKISLSQKLTERTNSWEGTQQAREAREEIDRALKIIPGTNMATLDPETAKRREIAQNELYHTLDDMEPNKRQGAAIAVAQGVIAKRIRTETITNGTQAQSNLAAFKAKYAKQATYPIGSPERTKYDNRVQDLERQIAEGNAAAERGK